MAKSQQKMVNNKRIYCPYKISTLDNRTCQLIYQLTSFQLKVKGEQVNFGEST